MLWMFVQRCRCAQDPNASMFPSAVRYRYQGISLLLALIDITLRGADGHLSTPQWQLAVPAPLVKFKMVLLVLDFAYLPFFFSTKHDIGAILLDVHGSCKLGMSFGKLWKVFTRNGTEWPHS